jgi:NAD-dependent deacetylase
MDDDVERLKEMLAKSSRIVFFGGAGTSTESGIPDFRSVDGLYSQSYQYPPETILSHTFFMANPAEFYRFYRSKMICTGVKPNTAHLALARLEADGKLLSVVTQNIDGLHQLAGSKKVYELHGSVHRNYCMSCSKPYPLQAIIDAPDDVPRCDCGGIIRPDVVLYEEGLNEATIDGALRDISRADCLIVGGTSLVVYPAAGLIDYYHGDRLVLINKTPTPMDRRANLVITRSIGETLGEAVYNI